MVLPSPKQKRGKNMNYNINFQKAKRNYIVLTFDDEREVEKDGEKTIEEYERTIYVGMPKKRVFSALMDMQEIMDRRKEAKTEKEKNEVNREIIDELYELVAKILSNNMKKELITTKWVEDQFSSEELQDFLIEYTKFANGEATNPN